VLGRITRREHEADGVIDRRFVDRDAPSGLLQLDDVGRIEQTTRLGVSSAIRVTIARSSVGLG
jgi:hypothetical protein